MDAEGHSGLPVEDLGEGNRYGHDCGIAVPEELNLIHFDLRGLLLGLLSEPLPL